MSAGVKMELQVVQSIALFASLSLMVVQLLVRNKQLSHILFAVFSGSIALSLVKDLSAESVGAYQFLIGMGACATCNCYWLLSRSLFRGEKGISFHHVLLAGFIALLIMMNQGFKFATSVNFMASLQGSLSQYILSELTILLSSCILVLSFWEGARGIVTSRRQEKAQRILFLLTFGGAVAISKLSQGFFVGDLAAQEMTTTLIILFVLINTQVLVFWRCRHNRIDEAHVSDKEVDSKAQEQSVKQPMTVSAITGVSRPNSDTCNEDSLSFAIKQLVVGESLFLQPNLKIADIARKLEVSEYQVSDALRNKLNARNFSQYINGLRIEHAQSLLIDAANSKWPVLVVGLESGFASVGPFTRAFKSITGYTPNQYRQKFKSIETA